MPLVSVSRTSGRGRHLEVDQDDVVEDGAVVGEVALQELYLGHRHQLLRHQVLANQRRVLQPATNHSSPGTGSRYRSSPATSAPPGQWERSIEVT